MDDRVDRLRAKNTVEKRAVGDRSDDRCRRARTNVEADYMTALAAKARRQGPAEPACYVLT